MPLATTLHPDQLARYLSASRVVSWAVEITDTGHLPRWVSPNVEQLLGCTTEEALAPTFWASRLHPEDRDRALADWDEARAGRRDTQTYRMLHRDGRVIQILDSMRYLPPTADRPADIVGAWTDISDQHRAETHLAESEERLRLAVDAGRQGLWDLDLRTGVAVVSPAYASMLGYDPDTFVETHADWVARMPAEDRVHCQAAFDRLARGLDNEYRIEFRQRTATGDTVWVQSVGRVVQRDADGTALRMLGTHTDITALKASEERTRASARFNEQLLEHVSEGVVACDETGRLSVFNRVARGWHGLGPETTLDVDAWSDRYNLFEGDGRTPLVAERIPLWRAFSGETLREVQMCIAAPGRPLRRIVASGGPVIGDDGRKLGALVLMRDVTAEHEADAAVRLCNAALEAAAMAIVITDRDGVIEWANPAFSSLTGFELGEALGRNPRELVRSGKQPRALYTAMWDTILAGRTWQGEVINRRKDGTEYAESLTITPVRDGDGEIAHFVAFKRDLTDEHAKRQQFLQSQKLESVGRLAGGIAHDFNNLLTVINGTVELALASLSTADPLQQDLADIRDAGERASTLTRQLLAFSRQQVLRAEVVSPDTIIDQLSKMLVRLLGEDVTLAWAPRPEAWTVRIDPGQLEQVIVNLCVNARDAMARGGTLTIRTEDVTRHEPLQTPNGVLPPGEYVSISIEDSGTGMSAEVLGRLFEPFFTTKAPGKGTGLGLATVYGIVQQSEGGITVRSTLGVGTEFRVYLPRVSTDAVRRPTPVELARIDSAAGIILVVDDETAVRTIAARILSRVGYQVLTAADGSDALDVVERHQGSIDLLLTDVVMPGMSGPELYAALRDQYPQMAVLFSSGYTDDTVVRNGLDGAEVPFLQKPYSSADLTSAVQQLLTPT